MTWVIEVDVDDVATGPLHGEITALVSDQLATYVGRLDYVTKVRTTWREDNDLDEHDEPVTRGELARMFREAAEFWQSTPDGDVAGTFNFKAVALLGGLAIQADTLGDPSTTSSASYPDRDGVEDVEGANP